MDAENERLGSAKGEPIPLSAPLRIEIRRERGVKVVRLSGSVQMDEADELKVRLPALIDPADPSVVFDLDNLDFISSVGLSALLAAQSKARSSSGGVHIARPMASVASLLQLTRVDQIIPVHATLDAAFAAAGKPE